MFPVNKGFPLFPVNKGFPLFSVNIGFPLFSVYIGYPLFFVNIFFLDRMWLSRTALLLQRRTVVISLLLMVFPVSNVRMFLILHVQPVMSRSATQSMLTVAGIFVSMIVILVCTLFVMYPSNLYFFLWFNFYI